MSKTMGEQIVEAALDCFEQELRQTLRTEHTLDPNLTVLNYLREHLHKSGTKDGCASGDCGACTVVVGELHTNDQGLEQCAGRVRDQHHSHPR